MPLMDALGHENRTPKSQERLRMLATNCRWMTGQSLALPAAPVKPIGKDGRFCRARA